MEDMVDGYIRKVCSNSGDYSLLSTSLSSSVIGEYTFFRSRKLCFKIMNHQLNAAPCVSLSNLRNVARPKEFLEVIAELIVIVIKAINVWRYSNHSRDQR